MRGAPVAGRFDYLLGKLAAAEIDPEPFPHISVAGFLEPEDFHGLVTSGDIALPACADIDALFESLDAAGYEAIRFPGCTKSRSEYEAWFRSGHKPSGLHDACEGMGMALRCTAPRTQVVRALDAFFRSDDLSRLLRHKFGIVQPTVLDCGLQKYLHGYEISPHPDIRQKALTWMFNANPGPDTEAQDYHTHLMVFRERWDFIRRFWRDHPEADTCWVPWEWCETRRRTTANNSLTVFAPRHDTLHAVKADYDPLPAQRTQFYGNLWYRPEPLPFRPEFRDFADGREPRLSRGPTDVLKSWGRQGWARLRGWAPKR